MRVIHFKRTLLAWAPDALSDALGRYAGIESRVVQRREELPAGKEARETLVHFHNQYVPYEGPSVLQMHSEPGNPSMMLPGEHGDDPWLPKYQMVLAQYHATLPEFQGLHVVRNVIDFNRPEYDVRPVREFRVALSPSFLGAPRAHLLRRFARAVRATLRPSTRGRRKNWFDKGVPEVMAILASLKSRYPNRFDFDLIHGVPLAECLARKAAAAMVIDDMKTRAGYHRAGLEGLALGKITFAWLAPEVERVLLDASGAPSCPFVNCSLRRLEGVLEDMLRHATSEELVQQGLAGRAWMESYWHPEVICREYLDHYRAVLAS